MPGKVQEYKFDVESADVDMDDIDGRNIEMEILGSNAWLPSSIWAIGEDITRDRKLLVHIPDWPTDQFWSTDRSKGEPRRFLRRIEIHDHRQ
ncbi:hypothetical protein FBY33_1388 [Arthrobacter sp. SLBN-112]|nr:hypothetical protein FBY33_1388 [Arthrobacter sp. SLBN-112]